MCCDPEPNLALQFKTPLEDIEVTVVEGGSMEPIEYMSPEVIDKEVDTITIEISGTNDII